MRLMPQSGMVPGQMKLNPMLDPKNEEHVRYVRHMLDFEQHYLNETMPLWKKQMDWWELFLAQQKDERDPVDEMWRSDVFVPLPFITTRTKAAQTTELLGNTEPVWQVEATQENKEWYDQSRHFERLLDYTARMNSWRKFLYKLTVARSVQGTAFFKVVWVKKSHVVTFFPTQEEEAKHAASVAEAMSMGLVQPPDRFLEPDLYQQWIEKANLSGNYGHITSPPLNGPTDVIEYEGPIFQYLPLWSLRLDPLIDEITDQKVIIHRMIKPLKYILDRADDDPNSRKPFLRSNVLAAAGGPEGFVLEENEQELAEKLGVTPNRESHPSFTGSDGNKPVEILEIHSKDEAFKFAMIMNRKHVINKRASESPFLTSTPNIFALRNIMVPGHMYGLSDYQQPERLFRELNQFRRIRMDGATLTTLPVFVKSSTVQLTEALRKLKPGAIITIPGGGKDAIQSLIQHTLPAEAYREPAEIKLEIEDATEVYSSTKGAPATIGRVTGTEYQGRASQVLLKYKVDASLIEEELMMLPSIILSFYAQMGPAHIKQAVGGNPDAMIDIGRNQLVEAINMRFRFRGATKNIQPDMAVQQIMQLMTASRDVLTPAERRFGLRLVLELLDIRGYSEILSAEGTQMFTDAQKKQQEAVNAQNQQVTDQAGAASVPVPGAIPADVMASIVGGGGAQ